jgi:DNA-directed RNA polymerase subunit K/omega
MKRKDSRSPMLDNEKCVKEAGDSRFNLVLIAAERLRELRRQRKENIELPPTTVDALLDIQNSKVNPTEYLAKVGKKNKS